MSRLASTPEGIDIHSQARKIYMTNRQSDHLSVINADTLEVERGVTTGVGSRAFGSFLLQ